MCSSDLVIHGIDGIGWEALESESVDEYFQYIKSKEDKLWVATFGDVAKYMRERMNANVTVTESREKIIVNLNHTLDKTMYDLPLTLRTVVSPKWKQVTVKQGNDVKQIPSQSNGEETYVLYQAVPGGENIEITPL